MRTEYRNQPAEEQSLQSIKALLMDEGNSMHMSREGRKDSSSEKRYKIDDFEIESNDLEPLYNSIVKYDKVRRSKDRKCYGYSGATMSKNITTLLVGILTACVAYGLSVCVVSFAICNFSPQLSILVFFSTNATICVPS